MLAILLLGLIFTLLIEQPLLLALDEGLKVSPVTIQPLAVQVDDVCGYGIQEVAVVGDDQDCGGPRLRGGSQDGRPSLGRQSAPRPQRSWRQTFPRLTLAPVGTHLQVILQPQDGPYIQHVCGFWKSGGGHVWDRRARELGTWMMACFCTPKSGCPISNSPSNSSRSGLWKRRTQGLRF